MFVGGEFYYDGWGRITQPVIDTRGMTFLNGGKACLIVISDYLLSRGIDRILLPSYLCPTIVDTLEGCGLACDYYQVNRDFSSDLADLQRQAEGHPRIIFHHYFGFQHTDLEFDSFLFSKGNGDACVEEDNALCDFQCETLGDFVFCSLRKLAPYDGGYLITVMILRFIEKRSGTPNRRLPWIPPNTAHGGGVSLAGSWHP